MATNREKDLPQITENSPSYPPPPSSPAPVIAPNFQIQTDTANFADLRSDSLTPSHIHLHQKSTIDEELVGNLDHRDNHPVIELSSQQIQHLNKMLSPDFEIISLGDASYRNSLQSSDFHDGSSEPLQIADDGNNNFWEMESNLSEVFPSLSSRNSSQSHDNNNNNIRNNNNHISINNNNLQNHINNSLNDENQSESASSESSNVSMDIYSIV